MSDVTRNRRDGVLKALDGNTTAPVETEILFMESDFTYSEPEAAEDIAVKNRKGELDHIKAGDPFNGWGRVSFSLKYVDKNIKAAITNPVDSSAIDGDKIPGTKKTVNLEYTIYDEDGSTPVETHKLYNVFFDPGKVVFSEGDEFDTLKAEGVIYGKISGDSRVFTETA